MKETKKTLCVYKKYSRAAAILFLWLAAFFGGREVRAWQEAAAETEMGAKKDYIHWVEFNVTRDALQQAYDYEMETHGTEHPISWIELLAYLGAKYGGDFKRYSAADMSALAERLRDGGETMDQIADGMKYYPYYLEAYTAVLGGMVGEYEVCESGVAAGETEAKESGTETERNAAAGTWVRRYGLKAFHPIAKGFPYSEYEDFGVARSYGYKRNHLGHDMMGQVGTPIIAVESGYVAALGWNQYGGWRVGINSFDGKRYYYYAHMRQNFPYARWLKVGSVVQAGDVIGYMGRTGYSAKENVNNINAYHLHFGLQLIFDESQREGTNQIWVNPCELIRFLHQNQSEAARDGETKEWSRVVQWRDSAAEKASDTVTESETAPAAEKTSDTVTESEMAPAAEKAVDSMTENAAD